MPADRQPPFDTQESLSAAMDGESHELELRRLLSECADSAELRQRWARYHLASAVIQKQPVSFGSSLAFADAVRHAIDEDNTQKNQGNKKIFSRIAVAASVALVVVVGAQWQQNHQAGDAQQLARNVPVIDHHDSFSEQKLLASMPSALGVDNIFTQSDEARNSHLAIKAQFKNVSMNVESARAPLIKASRQNFSSQ
ncbi:MAG: sigma-E factor negative regulatory protein [Pseudomonadales bacterium]